MNALAVQAQRGGTLGEHLVLAGAIDDESLADFYRTRLMVPQVTLRQLAKISKDIIQRVPADMATEHRCVPVSYDRDGNLTVAMAEPSNTQTVDELGFFTSSYVIRAVATQSQIAWALAHYYGRLTQLGQKLLTDPSGVLIPGPMPPRKALTPVPADGATAQNAQSAGPAPGSESGEFDLRPAPASTNSQGADAQPADAESQNGAPSDGSDAPSADAEVSADSDDNIRRRVETNSEASGGNTSGEFMVSDVLNENADSAAAPDRQLEDHTARLPSSRPVASSSNDADESAEGAGATTPENAASTADDRRSIRDKLPLPARLPERPSATSGPIPVIIRDEDSPPTYRPRPSGRMGRPQRVISFFQEDTPQTREIQAVPMEKQEPEYDPDLPPRVGEVSVRSQPIQTLEKSLPAVVIDIAQEPETPASPAPEPPAPESREQLPHAAAAPVSTSDSELAPAAQSAEAQPAEAQPAAAQPAAAQPAAAQPAAAQSAAAQPAAAQPAAAADEPPATVAVAGSQPHPAEVPSARAETANLQATLMDDPEDVATATTMPPPHSPRRYRRKRTRTFQGLGIGDAQPVERPPANPETGDHEFAADSPGTDPEAVPAGLVSAAPQASSGADDTARFASSGGDEASARFDDFTDGGFDSGRWNEIFSDGAPVRAPDMPTLRVSLPADTDSGPRLNAWPAINSPGVSVVNSIQKAAEAAAEAHARRTARETQPDGLLAEMASTGQLHAPEPSPDEPAVERDALTPEADADAAARPPARAEPSFDADLDAGPDNGLDAGLDNGLDAGLDNGPDAGLDNGPAAGLDDDDDDDDDDSDLGYDPTSEMDVAELPTNLEFPAEPIPPAPVKRPPALSTPGTITGESTGRVERKPATIVNHGGAEDDEWGPPGTTIPPPFLGAVSYDESGNLTGIPLITDDIDDDVSDVADGPLLPLPGVGSGANQTSDGTVVPINPPGSGRHDRTESSVQAPLSLYDSENVTPQVLREFDASQESLAEQLRRLQLAESRDAVIQVLLDRMAESHKNVAFFVIKNGRLEPFKSIGGTGLAAADPGRLSKIWLRLDFASTFQDIVATRLPYRGPITDQASRDFVYKTFGAVGDKMLGLPVTIRERVVGVLYGDNNTQHVFVQNLGVLVRAAGGALERIIKFQKG